MKTVDISRPSAIPSVERPKSTKAIRIADAHEYTSQEVKRIRQSVGMTQGIFAECLGVTVKAVEAWESGRNIPSGSTRRLLEMLDGDPLLFEHYGVVEIDEQQELARS